MTLSRLGVPFPSPTPLWEWTRGQMALLRGGVLLWGDQGALQDAQAGLAAPIDVPLASGQQQPVAGAWPLSLAGQRGGFNEPYRRARTGPCLEFGPLGTWHADAPSSGALLLRLPGRFSLLPRREGLDQKLGHPPGRSPRRPGQASRVPASVA